MSTVLYSLRLWRRGLIVRAAKSGLLSQIVLVVLLALVTMGPFLVALAVLLDNALGLPLTWTRVLATTLVLGPAFLFMRKLTRSCIQTETGEIPSTARTNRVEDVLSSSEVLDYEGLSGQMVNLGSEEAEFLAELVEKYLEIDDLSQREWGFAKGVQEKLEEVLA